eukprot:1392236-Amorphochlora_amoeboformis.AAC.1
MSQFGIRGNGRLKEMEREIETNVHDQLFRQFGEYVLFSSETSTVDLLWAIAFRLICWESWDFMGRKMKRLKKELANTKLLVRSLIDIIKTSFPKV